MEEIMKGQPPSGSLSAVIRGSGICSHQGFRVPQSEGHGQPDFSEHTSLQNSDIRNKISRLRLIVRGNLHI
jgi:hypothetical protein